MPRRSIILQELEENDKKLNSYNQAVKGYNAEVESRNANYNAAVAGYNAFAQSPQNTAGYGAFRPSSLLAADGQYYEMQDMGAPNWDGARKLTAGREVSWDEMQALGDAWKPAPVPDDYWGVPEWNPYVTSRPTAETYKGDALDANWNPLSLEQAQAEWDKTKSAYDSGALKFVESSGRYETFTGKKGVSQEWRPWNQDMFGNEIQGASPTRIMLVGTAPTSGPTPPPTPEEPRFYSLSRREEQELVNPTANAAEAALAANKGAPAKTELANQASTGLAGAQDTSAFAERDREESIKQSGILARVLAGQIA